MGKADVVPSRERSQISTRKHRIQFLLRQYWDLLAALLLVLGSFPTVWLSHRTVTLVPNLGLIDDNWHLDSPFKALQGIWIGRDVAFTHGPIFQWLSSIPARSMPLSFGGLYATWNTIPLWCAIAFAYVAIRLLLPEQAPWKRFVLVLLMCSFWELSLRTSLPVLMFAVFLRGWYAVRDGKLRAVFAGVAGALLCVIAFLVAGDTGIYTTAAWGICFVAFGFETRRDHFASRLLSALAAFVGASLLLAIVVNCFMATPLDFKFWRDSLAQISVYRWATPGCDDRRRNRAPGWRAADRYSGVSDARAEARRGTGCNCATAGISPGSLCTRIGRDAKRAGALRHRPRNHRRVRDDLLRQRDSVLVSREAWLAGRRFGRSGGMHAVFASGISPVERHPLVWAIPAIR